MKCQFFCPGGEVFRHHQLVKFEIKYGKKKDARTSNIGEARAGSSAISNT
jgi:hypothetical protein